MLCISQENIEQAVTCQELINAMESAFKIYEENLFNMPNRMHIDHQNNTLLLMPCITDDFFSTKLVSVFPGNSEKNLPVVDGVVVLNDGQTGQALAVLNGSKLTAMRTAAIGSVGIRYLAPHNAKTLGLIGAGVQGFQQVQFACSERNIENVFIYDKFSTNLDDFCQKLKEKMPQVSFEIMTSVESLMKQSQVIITTTTSNEPVIPNQKDLFIGKNIIAIGSFKPDMRELPDVLSECVDQVFMDTDFAAKESGDLAIPLRNGVIQASQLLPLGKLITNKVQKSENPTTYFKSVGMALFDLVAARLIYQKAVQQKLGTLVSI
jgi:ornithine cyclodeaminase/alanine dehydrogenase-like protein (mu-crystallin family)